MIEALFAAHPEYKEVPFVRIDEKKEPELADKYDYYYVPCFFAGEDYTYIYCRPRKTSRRPSPRPITDRSVRRA